MHRLRASQSRGAPLSDLDEQQQRPHDQERADHNFQDEYAGTPVLAGQVAVDFTLDQLALEFVGQFAICVLAAQGGPRGWRKRSFAMPCPR